MDIVTCRSRDGFTHVVVRRQAISSVAFLRQVAAKAPRREEIHETSIHEARRDGIAACPIRHISDHIRALLGVHHLLRSNHASHAYPLACAASRQSRGVPQAPSVPVCPGPASPTSTMSLHSHAAGFAPRYQGPCRRGPRRPRKPTSRRRIRGAGYIRRQQPSPGARQRGTLATPAPTRARPTCLWRLTARQHHDMPRTGKT